MEAPITQSKAWQKLQQDLNEESFFEQTDAYQYLAIKKSTPAGNYLYCPYGPALKDQKSLKMALKSLQNLAKTTSAIFIRIEPRTPLDPNFLRNTAKTLGLTAAKTKDLNPKETWELDLTGPDDDFIQKLPSRLLRYHRNMEKQGITIETSRDPADIHHLLDLQKALAKKKHISTFSENYLKTELSQPFATLYLLKQNSELLAAGLVFDDETTRYNLQGAQTDAGRKLHATGILTIELIKDARKKALKTFDFWGIAPEGADASHPWAGFTAFKKTFAGYERDFTGTYDLVLGRPRYAFYKFLRRLRRLF